MDGQKADIARLIGHRNDATFVFEEFSINKFTEKEFQRF